MMRRMQKSNDVNPDPAAHGPLGVALVGYGSAARVFHAPLIAGVPGLALRCVCSTRAAQVHADWSGVRVVAQPEAVWSDPSIDLVVLATPNATHYPLALAALQAGKHVLVDKPCTVTLAQTEHLLAVAQAQGRVLTVFQNRRYDSDFLTLQQVLARGSLGRVVQVDSHFDRYRPEVPQRWREQPGPGSGLWFDLGPHLLDQALLLWGEPEDMTLDLACVRVGAQVDDWFHAVLRYTHAGAPLRVLLHASTLVCEPGPRWAVHGTQGSFTQWGLDAQEQALKAGARPLLGAPGEWGQPEQPAQLVCQQTLPGMAQPVTVRQSLAVPGNYLQFYANLRDAIRHGTEPEVNPAHVAAVMRWLEYGARNAHCGIAAKGNQG
ncbi:MAG: oxidoreductase [Rhodoferax sp.]